MNFKATSIKTRIETFTTRLIEVYRGDILKQHPLKQGLKLGSKTKNPLQQKILKQHPLKQGLKRSMGSIDLDELLHFKATSIKTRIETLADVVMFLEGEKDFKATSIKTRIETIYTRLERFWKYNFKATSIKTRIETCWAPCNSVPCQLILKQHPLKQGLKQKCTRIQTQRQTILKQHPLKQGLKLFVSVPIGARCAGF